jgi:hypothetical protein
MKNNQANRIAFIFVWDNPPLIESCLQLGRTLQELSLEPVYISVEVDSKKLVNKHGYKHIPIGKIMDESFLVFLEWFRENNDVPLENRLFRGINIIEETRYEQYCLMNNYKCPLKCSSMHDLVMNTVLCLNSFSQLIDQYQPFACFVWNGLTYPPKGLKTLCTTAGIPLYHLERGLLPNYMVIDQLGINYGGSLGSHNWETLRKMDEQYDPRFVQRYTEKFRTEKVSIVNNDSFQNRDILSRLVSLKKTKKIILIPTQIDSDTNIIYYSPLFRTNEDAIKAILESMAKHNDVHIVVKTHPEDNAIDADSLKKILGDKGTVIANVHIHLLIEIAHAVVVRNSTVGLEALLFQKPVICLGKSAYSQKGFTYDVNTREVLVTILDHVLLFPEPYAGNGDKFYSFLYYLLNYYHYDLSQGNKDGNRKFLESMIFEYNRRPETFVAPQIPVHYDIHDLCIHRLEETIVEKNSLIHNIYNSRGWKLLKKYYHFRDKYIYRESNNKGV